MGFFKGHRCDFIVAHRVIDEEEDIVVLTPKLLVADAPEDTTSDDLKELFEKSNNWHLFVDEPSQLVDETFWREYKIVSDRDWGGKNWSSSADEFAKAAFQDGELYSEGSNPIGTTYDDLVASISDERRVTLRLPVGLYVTLQKKAKGTTLNSFCIRELAASVDYGEIEEFEAQRRKPGRPKKVQESE